MFRKKVTENLHHNYCNPVFKQHISNNINSNTNIWNCVYREILDHRDPLAKTVPLAFEASLEKEVYLAPR